MSQLADVTIAAWQQEHAGPSKRGVEWALGMAEIRKAKSILSNELFYWSEIQRQASKSAEGLREAEERARGYLADASNQAHDPFRVVVAESERFARTFPTAVQWNLLLSEHVFPSINRILPRITGCAEIRLCPECGTAFSKTRRDRDFCSESCGSRKRVRRMSFDRRAKSKPAKRSAAEMFSVHTAKCERCLSGTLCEKAEALLARSGSLVDAMDHVSGIAFNEQLYSDQSDLDD